MPDIEYLGDIVFTSPAIIGCDGANEIIAYYLTEQLQMKISARDIVRLFVDDRFHKTKKWKTFSAEFRANVLYYGLVKLVHDFYYTNDILEIFIQVLSGMCILTRTPVSDQFAFIAETACLRDRFALDCSDRRRIMYTLYKSIHSHQMSTSVK